MKYSYSVLLILSVVSHSLLNTENTLGDFRGPALQSGIFHKLTYSKNTPGASGDFRGPVLNSPFGERGLFVCWDIPDDW